MEPVILVGRRRDGGRRDALWSYCEAWWGHELGWPINVGYHEDTGPFCMSIASNRAAAQAAWDVALYVGADWIVRGEQAHIAAANALSDGRLWFAHDEACVLSRGATDRLLAGDSLEKVEWDGSRHPNTFSGVLAVSRALWDAVGGFDERFVGWGWEDLGFFSACAAVGGYERVNGTVYHLWHEQVPEQREGSLEHARNEPLGRRYLSALASAYMMNAMLREPGAPLDPARHR